MLPINNKDSANGTLVNNDTTSKLTTKTEKLSLRVFSLLIKSAEFRIWCGDLPTRDLKTEDKCLAT